MADEEKKDLSNGTGIDPVASPSGGVDSGGDMAKVLTQMATLQFLGGLLGGGALGVSGGGGGHGGVRYGRDPVMTSLRGSARWNANGGSSRLDVDRRGGAWAQGGWDGAGGGGMDGNVALPLVAGVLKSMGINVDLPEADASARMSPLMRRHEAAFGAARDLAAANAGRYGRHAFNNGGIRYSDVIDEDGNHHYYTVSPGGMRTPYSNYDALKSQFQRDRAKHFRDTQLAEVQAGQQRALERAEKLGVSLHVPRITDMDAEGNYVYANGRPTTTAKDFIATGFELKDDGQVVDDARAGEIATTSVRDPDGGGTARPALPGRRSNATISTGPWGEGDDGYAEGHELSPQEAARREEFYGRPGVRSFFDDGDASGMTRSERATVRGDLKLVRKPDEDEMAGEGPASAARPRSAAR